MEMPVNVNFCCHMSTCAGTHGWTYSEAKYIFGLHDTIFHSLCRRMGRSTDVSDVADKDRFWSFLTCDATAAIMADKDGTQLWIQKLLRPVCS